MSSHRRFHVAAPPSSASGLVRIEGEEAFHAVAVHRVRPGDAVTLFDGAGVEYTGVVEAATKRAVDVRIVSTHVVDREPRIAVTAAAAVPKSAHFDDAFRAACEIGLAAFVPIETERGLVRPSPHRVERWRRIAAEASKQSRRTRITAVLEPAPLRTALALAADLRAILVAGGVEGSVPLAAALAREPRPKSALLLVGPEGDFTPREVEAARAAGFAPASLGASTLRSETALVAATAAAALLGE